MKFCGLTEHDQRKNPLNYGNDPGYILDLKAGSGLYWRGLCYQSAIHDPYNLMAMLAKGMLL